MLAMMGRSGILLLQVEEVRQVVLERPVGYLLHVLQPHEMLFLVMIRGHARGGMDDGDPVRVQGLVAYPAPAVLERPFHHLRAVGYRRGGKEERVLESSPRRSSPIDRSCSLSPWLSSFSSTLPGLPGRPACRPAPHPPRGRAPRTISPPANSVFAEVFLVLPSARISPLRSTLTAPDQPAESTLFPMASIASCAPSVHSDPLISEGARRPEASSWPSTRPNERHPGQLSRSVRLVLLRLVQGRKCAPRRSAARRSSSSAGIWEKDRR